MKENHKKMYIYRKGPNPSRIFVLTLNTFFMKVFASLLWDVTNDGGNINLFSQ